MKVRFSFLFWLWGVSDGEKLPYDWHTSIKNMTLLRFLATAVESELAHHESLSQYFLSYRGSQLQGETSLSFLLALFLGLHCSSTLAPLGAKTVKNVEKLQKACFDFDPSEQTWRGGSTTSEDVTFPPRTDCYAICHGRSKNMILLKPSWLDIQLSSLHRTFSNRINYFGKSKYQKNETQARCKPNT